MIEPETAPVETAPETTVPTETASPNAGAGAPPAESGGWDQFVAAALVGTERQDVPRTALPDVHGPSESDPAARLLDGAALLAIQRRAGYQAAAGPLEPAPPEDQERVPASAGQRLARLLDGDHQRLLPEWVETAAARELRVPEELLPALLDRGATDRSLRPYLAAVAGRRGRWLAGLNPAWSFLLEERAGGTEVWELGTRGDRRNYLSELRSRDPAAAREALLTTWGQESAADRATFLALFDTGLSAADEEFLERVLDDRRREIRQVAADLLTRLPGSALGRRMAARSVACLRTERTLRGARVVAEPPTVWDPSLERDGVRERPPKGAGQRGWWLEQLLAHTPLATWTSHLGATPADIVRRVSGDWKTEIHAGWVRAAIVQRDPDWALALLDREPSGDLLAVLPAPARSAAGARVVAAMSFDGHLITLLGAVPGPWSGPLAAAVLAKIEQAAGAWRVRELSRLAGERMDPSLHDRARDEGLAETLRFRHDMLREFE